MKNLIKVLSLLFFTHTVLVNAASSDGVWVESAETQIASEGERLITPQLYRTLSFDVHRFGQIMTKSGGQLHLPLPDGSFIEFSFKESSVMHPELAKNYPQIKTWAGQAKDGSGAWARIDLTPAGFHGFVRTPQGSVYIDPYQVRNGQVVGTDYQVYYRSDYNKGNQHRFQCLLHDKDNQSTSSPVDGAFRTPVGSELRTYRTAVAANAEYTAFHGGTVAGGLAAIVTAINRVTGIYETELAIRLELIPNNDLLIFTNTATDGYTNNNGIAMLSQNQSKIDSVIGAANYDIGHVFSTGGGGIAGLGVVCRNNNKARGVTGLGSPIGDPFYVDYVAHEMGHQFGANHTFNGTASACGGGNRNASTAYEPGSGSTIMAYAGICGSHNIASNSDDHFHTASFDEITAYTTSGSGSVCPATVNTGNSAPVVDAGIAYIVPINTPLLLSGSATDPDGHALTYRWEQYDLGPGGSPASPTGEAPLFRSLPASSSDSRYLPSLANILTNNTAAIGDKLPTYDRSLSFRLTALDNQPGGGGVDRAFVSHVAIDTGSPFAVTSQNSVVIWEGGSQQTVTWDVAGTVAFPVSCPNVDISLSSDGGQNFVHALAMNTPNDGSENITVPDDPSNNGRIMIKCSDNIFLDINNANIVLEPAPAADFELVPSTNTLAACAPDDAVLDIEVQSIGGFVGPVTLSISGEPMGSIPVFANNPVSAGSTTMLTLGTASVSAGNYTLLVEGSGVPGVQSVEVGYEVAQQTADIPLLESPSDQLTGVALSPVLTWLPSTGAASYLVELSNDAGFSTIIESDSVTATSYQVQSVLAEATAYFWRVSAVNACGTPSSAVSSFTTVGPPVTFCSTPGLAIPDNQPSGIGDIITITDLGSVSDIDVSLDVTHPYIGDLSFALTNVATGTSVDFLVQPGSIVIPGGCLLGNIDAVIDDEAVNDPGFACEGGGVALPGSWLPSNPLALLDGQNITGDWRLTSSDLTSSNTGALNEWCVTITVGPPLVGDFDDDGVFDDIDNCTEVANPNQIDADGDGYGNVCDADLNNDGIINFLDLAAFQPLFLSTDPVADMNTDGVVNFFDLIVLTDSFLGMPGPSALSP